MGGILARGFRARGDDVVVLSRGGPVDGAGARIVAWDARTLGSWAAEIDGADVAVRHTRPRSIDARVNELGRAPSAAW